MAGRINQKMLAQGAAGKLASANPTEERNAV
jgi:hypothetical protein